MPALATLARTRSQHPLPQKPTLTAEFTTDIDVIRESQRLRYEVFCDEYGIELPVSRTWRGVPIDAEPLDEHSLHLVIRAGAGGPVVGYTRAMTASTAAAHGAYYSADEFHLERLLQLDASLLEIGRTCIHPDYRTGGTITLLWGALARYMQSHGIRYLFGCASIGLQHGTDQLAALLPYMRHHHLAPSECKVVPKLPLPGLAEREATKAEANSLLPPLLKAYLRIGARICGEPCLDPAFNVADFLVILDLEQVAPRYARHFLQPAISAA